VLIIGEVLKQSNKFNIIITAICGDQIMEIENLFYTEPASIVNGFLELQDQEAKHAAKVMRSRVGDTLYASDGLGNIYESEVTEINKTKITG
jgi:hypothetical protein